MKINSPMENLKIYGKMIVQYNGTNTLFLEQDNGLKYFKIRLNRKKLINDKEERMVIEFTLHDHVTYVGSLYSHFLYEDVDLEDEGLYFQMDEKSFISNKSIILDNQYIIFRGRINIYKYITLEDTRNEGYNYELIFNYSKQFADILTLENFEYLYFNPEV